MNVCIVASGVRSLLWLPDRSSAMLPPRRWPVAEDGMPDEGTLRPNSSFRPCHFLVGRAWPTARVRRGSGPRRRTSGHVPPSSCPSGCYREALRARSSAGERSPHTREVAGSIPAAPTVGSAAHLRRRGTDGGRERGSRRAPSACGRSTAKATRRSRRSTVSTSSSPTGRVHRDHGPVGLGQVDAAALPGRARHPDERAGLHRRHRDHDAVARSSSRCSAATGSGSCSRRTT